MPHRRGRRLGIGPARQRRNQPRRRQHGGKETPRPDASGLSLDVDADGNVWVTDAVGYAPVPAGVGHTILKYSPNGELMMTLGVEGVAGEGEGIFNKPSDVLVAPDGSIFVADGHDAGGNNRIVKLDPGRSFLMAWGETGTGTGQFRDPHAPAMDSQGRLFVADRGNSRIQIFDQEGAHLETWTQFGRPSGLSSTPTTYSTPPIPSRTPGAIAATGAAST